MIPACLYSIFGRGPASVPPIRMYFVVWMVLFNFFVSHFEKYNTGVLYLPWGYDFGMWVSKKNPYDFKKKIGKSEVKNFVFIL